MSQFNMPMGGPPPIPMGAPTGLARTSGLAVASLVCALVFCVPFLAPLAGLVLGIAALVSISRSAGRKRGGGLAVAGIAIGSLVLLLHAAVTAVSLGIALPFLNAGVGEFHTFVAHLEKKEYAEARAQLSSAAAAQTSDDDLKALRLMLEKQYGAIQQTAWDWRGRVYMHGVRRSSSQFNSFSFAAGAGATGASAGAAGNISLAFQSEFEKRAPVFGLVNLNLVQTSAGAGVTGAGAKASFGRPTIDSFTLIGPNGQWSFPFPPSTLPAAPESRHGDRPRLEIPKDGPCADAPPTPGQSDAT